MEKRIERTVLPMATQTHLSLEDRIFIQKELTNHSSFRKIALALSKDPTTIAKEVKRHRIQRNIGFSNFKHNECIHRKTCTRTKMCKFCTFMQTRRCAFCGQCTHVCSDFVREVCQGLEKAPFVCNGCSRKHSCSLTKYVYAADVAHQKYRDCLSSTRTGMNFTELEIGQIDNVLSPLLKQGQSIHHILVHNPGLLPYSEKTLYTLVNSGLLSARNLDLARKVRLMPRKKTKVVKVDRACRTGRSYEDFKRYLETHDEPNVVQMDTVEGIKGGSNLMTLYFQSSGLMLAFKRPLNNARSVLEIMNALYAKLGHETYARLFEVLLTDNGYEFSNPNALEFTGEGQRRSHLFYCDPASPYQKGACERNHELIRAFIPKHTNFNPYSQEQINLMMSHINSYARKKLNNKSPAYLFSLLESPRLLAILEVEIIPPNQIHLSSKLFIQR